jgi:putative intracellular protease/amidase
MMKKRICYLFVFDGYADWEPSLTIAGLQKFTDFSVKTFSKDGKPVHSMGNILVTPELHMERVLPNDVDLLLLPGGDLWDQGGNLEITPVLNAVLDQNRMVAAICGATGFLAQHGYLDEIKHTSNHLDFYLRKVAPDYHGEKNYVKEHAVKDGNLITANGTAIVEFADKIFEHFNLYEEYEDLASWFRFFKQHEMVIS